MSEMQKNKSHIFCVVQIWGYTANFQEATDTVIKQMLKVEP